MNKQKPPKPKNKQKNPYPPKTNNNKTQSKQKTQQLKKQAKTKHRQQYTRLYTTVEDHKAMEIETKMIDKALMMISSVLSDWDTFLYHANKTQQWWQS